MPIVKTPHQTPEDIIRNAQQEDPWVMYYVVRQDRQFALGQAMSLAGAATVFCADKFRLSQWQDNFARWYQESYRKVILRATEDQFNQVKLLDSVCLNNHQGEALLCLPPRRKSECEAELTDLRPFTDAKKAQLEAAPNELAMTYIIRPNVFKSTGKAMAQAGHAALMCADFFAEEYKDELEMWRETGCPGVVLMAEEGWDELKTQVDCTFVTDAGLTQLVPGTETVLVVPPGAMSEEMNSLLELVL